MNSNVLHIPPEVEVCLFGLEDKLGQFLKHELVTRQISNFSPTERLFNPRHGDLLLHLVDGIHPRCLLNCIDDPKIIINMCEASVKYGTRFIHMGKKQTDLPKAFKIHNFASIKYDEPEISMVKHVMNNIDHMVGFHEYKNHKFTI